jgi:glycosyltransferase involved in cell wall biosynthesis
MLRWIPETVQSVTAQRYPALQYAVMDGASTDGTREWLNENRSGIACLRSESDAGQYHAIAKGFTLVDGEVMGWINGDDVLLPWTLRTVGHIFSQFPEVQWIVGLPAYFNSNSECILVSQIAAAYPQQYIRNGWYREGLLGYLNQENMFWRRSLWDKVGGLDLTLKWAADFDLWVRFAEHAALTAVATPLAAFRVRGSENRSRQGNGYTEEITKRCRLLPKPPILWRLLSRQGKPGEMLLRLLLWHRSPVVAHALGGSRWQLLNTRRPISRYDIPRLQLERSLRQ